MEFKPLVQLEEVKTQSGEEDEEVVFKMCARLVTRAASLAGCPGVSAREGRNWGRWPPPKGRGALT